MILLIFQVCNFALAVLAYYCVIVSVKCVQFLNPATRFAVLTLQLKLTIDQAAYKAIKKAALSKKGPPRFWLQGVTCFIYVRLVSYIIRGSIAVISNYLSALAICSLVIRQK